MLFMSIIVKIICGILLGYIVVKLGNAIDELGKVAICSEYIYDESTDTWIPYKEENRIWLLHSILVFIFYILKKSPVGIFEKAFKKGEIWIICVLYF